MTEPDIRVAGDVRYRRFLTLYKPFSPIPQAILQNVERRLAIPLGFK